MTLLLLIWLAWMILATGLGIVIGLSIREADRREQPTPDDIAEREIVAWQRSQRWDVQA